MVATERFPDIRSDWAKGKKSPKAVKVHPKVTGGNECVVSISR